MTFSYYFQVWNNLLLMDEHDVYMKTVYAFFAHEETIPVVSVSDFLVKITVAGTIMAVHKAKTPAMTPIIMSGFFFPAVTCLKNEIFR